jgi:hypothetical protein
MLAAVAAWTAAARRVVLVARRCLPVDARRPASWIGAACALATGWWLAARGSAEAPGMVATGAILGGTAAALAALGDPPHSGSLPRCAMSRLAAAQRLSRSAWPLAAAAGAPLVGAPLWGVLLMGLAIVGAVVALGIVARGGADAAEAIGATWLIAFTAAVAADLSVGPGSGFDAGASSGTGMPQDAASHAWVALSGQVLRLAAAATAGWIAALVAVRAWQAGEFGLLERAVGETGAALGWPLAAGQVSRGLVVGAMLAALLGMAAWLFLDPAGRDRYAALAAATFVCVALPRATLAWGDQGGTARGRLLATAAGPAGSAAWGRRLDRLCGLGFTGPEWRAPLAVAAIVGWPALVAAAVGGAAGGGRGGLLWLVGMPVLWAVALAGVGVAVLRAGGARETAHAVAVAVALGWAALHNGLLAGETGANGGRTGVEESASSCQTPLPQPSPAGFAARHDAGPNSANRLTRGVHPCEEARSPAPRAWPPSPS